MTKLTLTKQTHGLKRDLQTNGGWEIICKCKWTRQLQGDTPAPREKNSFSATLCNYNNDDLIIYDKKLTPEIQNQQ